MLCVLALLVMALPRGEGFFEEIPQMETLPPDGGDPGEPLFLTPYIEAGNLEEGRRLSRVSFPDLPSVKSYSGFVTVNKTYNSNLFFWYFPNDKPCFSGFRIYIQGFQGVSSMFGQFEEHGPIEIVKVNNTLKPENRLINWNKLTPMLYLDHAVGAGFSFTNDSRGYSTSQEEIGDQLFSALSQIMKLFPEVQKLKLLLHGELYAGKFIVSLARAISLRSGASDVEMNLSQLSIGSGWCNPISQLSHHKYTYHTGLHDWNMKEYIKQFEYNTTLLIKQEKWLEASDYYLEGIKKMRKWSGGVSYMNFMEDVSHYKQTPNFVAYVQSSPARRALHVGDLKFQDGVALRDALKPDFMKSVAPWMFDLEKQHVLVFYNGVLGVMVPYLSSIAYFQKFDPNYAVLPWRYYYYIVGYNILFHGVMTLRLRNEQIITTGHLPVLDNKVLILDTSAVRSML